MQETGRATDAHNTIGCLSLPKVKWLKLTYFFFILRAVCNILTCSDFQSLVILHCSVLPCLLSHFSSWRESIHKKSRADGTILNYFYWSISYCYLGRLATYWPATTFRLKLFSTVLSYSHSSTPRESPCLPRRADAPISMDFYWPVSLSFLGLLATSWPATTFRLKSSSTVLSCPAYSRSSARKRSPFGRRRAGPSPTSRPETGRRSRPSSMPMCFQCSSRSLARPSSGRGRRPPGPSLTPARVVSCPIMLKILDRKELSLILYTSYYCKTLKTPQWISASTLPAAADWFWRDPGVTLKGRISRLPEQPFWLYT